MNNFSHGRPVDPATEADRLARERMHEPAKVLHPGDVIRFYGPGGLVFTGRVDGTCDPPTGGHAFALACVPLEPGGE